MKKTAVIICGLLCCLNLNSQNIHPIIKQNGKLNISVDPRTELLGVIQIVSGYKLTPANTPYGHEVLNFFKPYSGLKAAKLTDSLYNNGFSYDAPPAFLLYLSQPVELKKIAPYSDNLILRAKGENTLNNYADAISEFAKNTNFEKFWNSKHDFYNKIIDLTSHEIEDLDLISIIEHYFHEKQNSYNIIICPLFGQNSYGSRIKNDNGKYDIYSFTSPSNEKDGIPYLSRNNLTYLVLHEFSHSFVNPLSEKYIEAVNQTGKLFEPIKSPMCKMAYTNWETCLNEHIIRAIVIRLTEKLQGEEQAKALLSRELNTQFIYLEPIIEIMKRFEKERDTKNISFSEYFPALLNSLKEIKPGIVSFKGNINNTFLSNKLAIIYPSGGTDKSIMSKTKEYALSIADFIRKKQNKECLVISDSAALSTSLNGYGILCYGTIASNLYLSHYKASLPFVIENNSLIADNRYNDENLKFITCVPNPQDKTCGMIIYTAIKDESILNINNFMHGMFDYHIFGNNGNELSKGYYEKNDSVWKFIKK